jgi:hypothetical protein
VSDEGFALSELLDDDEEGGALVAERERLSVT